MVEIKNSKVCILGKDVFIHCGFDDIDNDGIKELGRGKMVNDEVIGGYMKYKIGKDVTIFPV